MTLIDTFHKAVGEVTSAAAAARAGVIVAKCEHCHQTTDGKLFVCAAHRPAINRLNNIIKDSKGS